MRLGKCGFVRESKEIKEMKAKSISDRTERVQTLTLEKKGQRDLPWTLRHRRSLLCDRICAAAHRGAAQGGAAARPPGRRGCACAGSTAKRRQRHTRRRRPHPPVSACTGEGAATAPPPFPGRHGRSGRRCVAWREKGEGKRVARVSGNTGVAGFDPARVAAGRQIRSDGRESSVASRAE